MKEKLQVKFHLLFIIYQCRGPEGFWKAYPSLKEKGIVLERMSTPQWFETDPKFAWGFFGHRYNLYQKTTPHSGFNILRKWCESKERGYFVFTSNVDGQFQKARFSEDRIVECHGSINFMQCCQPMEHTEIWPVPEDTAYDVDVDTLNLRSPLPHGPPEKNDRLARPNILMFGDWNWLDNCTKKQHSKFFSFQMSMMLKGGIPFAVVEIGAGESVPTVRVTSQDLVSPFNKGTIIRINPRDWRVPDGNISLPIGGLEALEMIEDELQKG